MNKDLKNKKINGLSESDIDAKNKIILNLDEKFYCKDNYTMKYLQYDCNHGTSSYSDENNRTELPYDSEENECIQQLKKKLTKKMKYLLNS